MSFAKRARIQNYNLEDTLKLVDDEKAYKKVLENKKLMLEPREISKEPGKQFLVYIIFTNNANKTQYLQKSILFNLNFIKNLSLSGLCRIVFYFGVLKK